MKISGEKRIVIIAALTGMLFGFRIVQFIDSLNTLAESIEAKPGDKQPRWLRTRYKPAAAEREAVNE